MAFDLTSFLGSSIGDAFAKVVAAFKVPPEQVLAAKVETDKIQAELQSKLMDQVTAGISGATEIIKAEAGSQSWLPRNVRPLLLLLWGLAITFNLCVPVIARFWIPSIQPLPIDPWIYKLTAIGFTGYVTARSIEKVKDADN